ncbi:hypothetical protein LX36DRAFT_23278 [Colletotrichum falcatum]|nr:hypothetical protein LX36DRAFT_23278 [Colletotrichum falcatum]
MVREVLVIRFHGISAFLSRNLVPRGDGFPRLNEGNPSIWRNTSEKLDCRDDRPTVHSELPIDYQYYTAITVCILYRCVLYSLLRPYKYYRKSCTDSLTRAKRIEDIRSLASSYFTIRQHSLEPISPLTHMYTHTHPLSISLQKKTLFFKNEDVSHQSPHRHPSCGHRDRRGVRALRKLPVHNGWRRYQ